MDLNTPQNLDPKLKEAYERMMGQKPPSPVITQSPQANEHNNEDDFLTPSKEPKHDAYGNVVDENTKENHSHLNEEHHQARGKFFIMILLVAVVFFIFYAYIWAKVFNLI